MMNMDAGDCKNLPILSVLHWNARRVYKRPFGRIPVRQSGIFILSVHITLGRPRASLPKSRQVPPRKYR